MQQYKVSELTEKIKLLMDGEFPGLIMVHAEVTDFFKASSGHIYLSLKDEGAKLKAVYFKNYIQKDSFVPANGDKVSVIGELRLYAPESQCQLVVRKIIYNTEGDFWKKFLETKKRLETENLFDADTKKPCPPYPKRIALLTAVTGAAVKDFIVTAKSYGNFFDIHIWPIPVQGNEAAAIAAAIKNAGGRTDIYDVLVLTRGGGSLEDLSIFNDELVARALKASVVPTVSAIGHEQDTTICDLVADVRAATPTAAAVFLSARYKEAEQRTVELANRLKSRVKWAKESLNLDFDRLMLKFDSVNPLNLIKQHYKEIGRLKELLVKQAEFNILSSRSRYDNLSGVLRTKHPKVVITEWKNKVETLRGKLKQNMLNIMSEEGASLSLLHTKLLYINPVPEIKSIKDTVDTYEKALPLSLLKTIGELQHKTDLIRQRLELTNPENIIKQGYAIVMKRDGSVVDGINSVQLQEDLEIKVKDGYIVTFVTGKKQQSNPE